MTKVFKRIIDLSDSPASLGVHIMHHLADYHDFVNSDYDLVHSERELIERFILFKIETLNKLDYSKIANRAFVIILYELCARLSLACAIRLENILEGNHLDLGSRLKATQLFLIDIKRNSDFIDRYELICELLENAYKHEEDDEIKVVNTFINYFICVLKNAHPNYIKQLIEKISVSIAENKYMFLNKETFNRLIQINPNNVVESNNVIQRLFVETWNTSIIRENNKSEKNYETENNYLNKIQATDSTCNSIRQISLDTINLLPANQRQDLYDALLRGVKPLATELELCAYMAFYMPMHYSKLKDAYEYLPKDFCSEDLEIYDWGCGQGIATMALLENQNEINYNNIRSITLLEPSQVALNRALINVEKFISCASIVPICQYLNDTNQTDFENDINRNKLHLFSNIIDIENFSLNNLLNLLVTNFKGLNYFVCVSPYIDDKKTARIDSFVDFFSANSSYRQYCKIDERKGQWIKQWTRVVRVFEVYIN